MIFLYLLLNLHLPHLSFNQILAVSPNIQLQGKLNSFNFLFYNMFIVSSFYSVLHTKNPTYGGH